MYEIHWLSGDRKGQTDPLKEGPTTFGRSRAADIYLKDRSLSMSHCRIERQGDVFSIEDLDSLAGTDVGGAKITGKQPLALGAVVGLGESSFSIRKGAAAAHEAEAPRSEKKLSFRQRRELKDGSGEQDAPSLFTQRSPAEGPQKSADAPTEAKPAPQADSRPRLSFRERRALESKDEPARPAEPPVREAAAELPLQARRLRANLEKLRRDAGAQDAEEGASELRRKLDSRRTARNDEAQAALEAKLAEREAEIQDLRRRVEDAEREARQAVADARKAKATIRKAEAESKDAADQRAAIEAQLEALRREIESIEARAAAKEAVAANAEFDIRSVRTGAELRLQEREAALKAEMAENSAKVAELRRKNEQLEADYVAQRDEIEALEADLEKAMRGKQDLEKQVLEKESRCQRLESELEEVEENIQELVELELAQHRDHLKSLNEKKDSLGDLIQRYEERIQELDARIEELEAVNADLRGVS